MTRAERAASEVLGYVLIFALVTATVGVVFTVGISGLESAQQAEQVNNVERAFDVLAHNFEEMYIRGSPSRSTEVRLIGGSMKLAPTVNYNVSTDTGQRTNITPTPIAYESDGGTRIVYEGGAIFRSDGNSSVMIREPAHVITDNRSILAVVRTIRSPGSETRVEGERIVLVVGSFPGASVRIDEPQDNTDVTVNMTTPRADAWERYFEDQDIGSVSRSGDELTYTFTTDEITVVRSRIVVELIP